MSSITSFDLYCPQCGNTFMVNAWGSVNVDMNPSLRAQAFNGSIFEHVCPRCKTSIKAFHNCLYHNMLNKFAVQFNPNSDERSMDISAGLAFNGYTLRLVSDINSFTEKIQILERSYNDKVIELLKAALIGDVQAKYPDKMITKLHMIFPKVDEFLRFQIISENKVLINMGVPKQQYDNLNAAIVRYLWPEPSNQFTCIDSNWINSEECTYIFGKLHN